MRYALPAVTGGLNLLALEDCRSEVSGTVTVGHLVPGRKRFVRDILPRSALEETPTLWLMVGRDWRRRGVQCLEWLDATHRVAEREEFTGVELLRLVRREVEAGQEGLPAEGRLDPVGRHLTDGTSRVGR